MRQLSDDELMHVGRSKRDGAPVGSGRYPLGSGDKPFQHATDFLGRIKELQSEGLTEKEIATYLGLESTTQLRVQRSIARAEERSEKVAQARALYEQGMNTYQIAKEMGYPNESSVRSLLNESSEARMNMARKTAEFLKSQVDKKGMIDVGAGVEHELGVSKEKLNEALEMLELEGYHTFGGRADQPTNPGQKTTIKVLCPPDTPYKVKEDGSITSSAIYDFENVHTVTDYISRDGGDTFDRKFVYPESMNSDRLQIRYAEDGGIKKDGVIEIRRGVDDLSLGEANYAQVRILVDDTHYLKGMAMYSDDMPKGVDVIFNTNKSQGTPMEKVLKEVKKDPDNPFGALIKDGINDPNNPASVKDGGQSYYYDKEGNKHLSLINKTREEGDWGEWSKHLASQFLSKQPLSLAKKQLTLTENDRVADFDEICSLTNPTVKKRLLESFADDCDAAAVHLKAAALPRQQYQVILPITSMKDNEIYAPNYNSGETVALIRYPHGGTFEIPKLTVNNKQPEARKLLGNAIDAVGINSHVAERLSGADFDGDTVLVIPTNDRVKITSTPPLSGLKDFDAKLVYGGKKEGTFKVMNNTQQEMGKISNLITDMTLKGASSEELARAVRHSMVVIDAEKHKLDYKQSEKDNGIAELRKTYQGHIGADGKYHEKASTLISRAKNEVTVPKRRGQPWVNPKTGELEWERTNPKTGEFESKTSNETYVDKTGKEKQRTQKSTQMAETKDARTLISNRNTPMENLYADYANKMKSLANQARKEILVTKEISYSPSAKKTYQKEVESLNRSLLMAQKNAPKERKAILIANSVIKAKKEADPDLKNDKKALKKLSQQELTKARAMVGAKRHTVKINDREWEAIQAGAISPNKLKQILNHTDIDEIRKRATPRTANTLSTSEINKIKAMRASGYLISDIAKALGKSSSTVSKYLK